MAIKRHAKEEAVPPVSREYTKSPAFFSIYANDVQVQTSPWDMRLVLGEIQINSDPDNKTIIANLLGEVRLSPQLAKRLTAIMLQQLKTYEEQMGVIPMPKEG